VVCAVNGVAAGAGANLAFACDLVLAKRSASFLQPFCKLGLLPDTGGTYFLPRLVGTARAIGLAMLGDKLPAQQAADWGLIWRCVDDDTFAEETEKLVAHLAGAPTLGLVRTKQAIYGSAQATLEQQLKVERDAMRELGFSEDYRDGVEAFLNKRTPVFHGR
jgi:2-(1,2-epoxy-1,2-dihydrophenyl)acetyl-CoA isomerase